MDDEAREIIRLITGAFAGVPRGAMTIHEAEVVDNYGTETERAKARKLDVDERWEDVPDRDIEACTTALSHLDPAGWRYYVPPYMIWALRHFRESNAIVIDATIYTFELWSDASLRDYKLTRFRLLGRRQSHAVHRFLRYMAANEAHADATVARSALENFWHPFAEIRED